jgi:hypothetical protein
MPHASILRSSKAVLRDVMMPLLKAIFVVLNCPFKLPLRSSVSLQLWKVVASTTPLILIMDVVLCLSE